MGEILPGNRSASFAVLVVFSHLIRRLPHVSPATVPSVTRTRRTHTSTPQQRFFSPRFLSQQFILECPTWWALKSHFSR
jgi:hypothetical protein